MLKKWFLVRRHREAKTVHVSEKAEKDTLHLLIQLQSRGLVRHILTAQCGQGS
jgi:hypothetical protein